MTCLRWLIVALICGWGSLSCTRSDKSSSQMKIRLPSSHAPSSKIRNLSGNVGWALADPQSMGEVMCYAVAVAGPEAKLKGKVCKSANNGTILDVGIIQGLYPAGSEVSLEVPSGKDREFYLIGFGADSKESCKRIADTGGRPLYSQLSAPHVVSKKMVSLEPGDQSITMFASLVGSQKLEDCEWDNNYVPAPVSPLVPVISSIEVFVNGILQGPPPIHMNVGDSLTMTVNAVDPQALPLQYSFNLFQNCTYTETIQQFSSENVMGSYVATNNDVNGCDHITIGIRNDDGLDYDSALFGDRQHAIPLVVSNGTSPPYIDSVEVRINGVPHPGLPVTAAVGDLISVNVQATDPNGLPLEYVFHRFENCTLANTLQAFSLNNAMAEYQLAPADVNGCSQIVVGVKNNDGVDYDSATFGDLQHAIPLVVSNGSQPPVVDMVEVYVNGVLQGPPPINMTVGDTITMTVFATDPSALPLEYSFHLSQNCTLVNTLQAFSPDNLMAGYQVTVADVNACNSIIIGVKNTDGTDYDGPTFGDLQYPIQLNVSDVGP